MWYWSYIEYQLIYFTALLYSYQFYWSVSSLLWLEEVPLLFYIEPNWRHAHTAKHNWVKMWNRSLVRILLFATVKRETATRVTQSSFTTLDTGWGWVLHKQQQQLGQRSSSIAIGLYVPCRYPLAPAPLGVQVLLAVSVLQLSFGMPQLSSANYSYTQKRRTCSPFGTTLDYSWEAAEWSVPLRHVCRCNCFDQAATISAGTW